MMIKISPENLSQVSARESEKKHLQFKLYSSAMIKRKIYKKKLKMVDLITARIEAKAEARRKTVPSLGESHREAEMPRRPWSST